MSLKHKAVRSSTALYRRTSHTLQCARIGVARTVNTTQVIANWLVGREIVEEQQWGGQRAGYGERLLSDLSRRRQTDFGRGYSVDNLEWFRQFYLVYPRLDAIKVGCGSSAARLPGKRGVPGKIAENWRLTLKTTIRKLCASPSAALKATSAKATQLKIT